MNRTLTPAECRQLEELLDLTSLSAVLEALATVCGQKAEHIRSEWQDHGLARAWDMAERLIDRVAEDREVTSL